MSINSVIMEEPEAREVSYIKELYAGKKNDQIYDSYYGGYQCGYDCYLVTRTDENTSFVLDDLDTPNIVIDPQGNWVEE